MKEAWFGFSEGLCLHSIDSAREWSGGIGVIGDTYITSSQAPRSNMLISSGAR